MLNESIPLLRNPPCRPEKILVNVTPQETRVAILENDTVHELHIERTTNLGLVGNIYLGQVKRVLPGMQSAFIEIGLERAGFLHIADVLEQRQHPEETQRIEHMLFEGKTIPVQVLKDPIGTKGARLTTQLSLAGRFLVLIPQTDHIGISQRIESEDERIQLKTRLEALISPDNAHGYILRTSAENATDEELKADIDYLERRWTDINLQAQKSPPLSLLYHDLPLSLRVLRDMTNDLTETILVDSKETYTRMLNFARYFVNKAVNIITLYHGERPLFETYDINTEIDRALARRVNLKTGGYLIIDQTEAMATIDVNTGGFVGHHNFEETIFKTNLEATSTIARQLRLRNMGGIIIVDFIDMENGEHQSAVLNELAKALSFDRTLVTLNGFTSLGLVEITRKRTRDSLARTLCVTCPTCQGRGRIKSAQAVCYDIQREIVREAKRFDVRSFKILASQEVIDMFLDEESQSLAQLIDFIDKPITLYVENTYTQEQFDVVLT